MVYSDTGLYDRTIRFAKQPSHKRAHLEATSLSRSSDGGPCTYASKLLPTKLLLYILACCKPFCNRQLPGCYFISFFQTMDIPDVCMGFSDRLRAGICWRTLSTGCTGRFLAGHRNRECY